MASIFVTFQSEQAIVVESNQQSYSCYKKALLITLTSSSVLFLLVPLAAFLPDFGHKTTMNEWMVFIPVALLITGLNNVHDSLFTFEKRFWLIAVIRIARPVVIYVFILVFWFVPGGNHDLIIGFVSGSGLVALFQLIIAFGNKKCRFNRSDFTAASFRWFYTKHRKILIFNTLSSGMTTISMQMPYLFIAAFYGEIYNAWYGMAMRIVGLPLSLLGQSMGQVYFQKFSQMAYYRHSIFHFAKKLVKNLYVLGAAPFILLLLLTPFIYTTVFGQEWGEASTLARVLLPWLFVLMVSAPVSRIIPVIGMQHYTIYYDIALFIARIVALTACSMAALDFFITMAVFSGLGVVFNVFFQSFILYLTRKHTPEID